MSEVASQPFRFEKSTWHQFRGEPADGNEKG
jgi:hypothetical protein